MGEQDEIPKEVQITLYATVGAVSLVCNSLIFLVIGTNKDMRTKSNYLLISLATTDWLIIVTGIPIHLINLIKGGNQTHGMVCDLFGFLILVPFLVSNFNLTLIAVHRYVLVVRNKSYRKVFTDKRIYMSIALVWGIGILLSIPPLLGWGSFSYNANRAHCMIDWQKSLSYLIVLQTMAYPAPMATMCFCYYKILRHSYESSKRLASSGDKHRIAKKKREVRLSIMLLLVLLCFFILFFPYAIMIIYEGQIGGTPSHTFSFISMLGAYSNSMVDFWIYAAMSTKFRQALKRLFYRIFGKLDLSPSTTDSSSDAGHSTSTTKVKHQPVPTKPTEGVEQETSINLFLPGGKINPDGVEESCDGSCIEKP